MSRGSLVDWVTIDVEGGKGGDGIVSFRREKYVPRGGPDGGDGGDGGSVILRVDPQKRTLLDFRYLRRYRGERGGHGKGKQMTGKRGKDEVILIPPGTLVRSSETEEPLADLVKPDARFVAASGGRGGKGNTRMKSSINQAPRVATPGQPGEERRLILELKLLADVGLVGQPNAGKSTLLSRVSRARPKIADYPFTTLEPVLGLVSTDSGGGFVLADIPGLIEGAHEGKGMGHEFLRHIERTRVLVYLLDGTRPDPAADLDMLKKELALHRGDLVDRPHRLVLNKADLIPLEDRDAMHDLPGPFRWISAVTGEGVDDLRRDLENELAKEEGSSRVEE